MVEIFTKKHRGFTLIELLVVIAIIGILASIVLVSLGGARTKAKDAAIKANVDSMRLAAEMFWSGPDLTYTGADADPSYVAARAAITGGNLLPSGGAVTDYIKVDGKAYCIQADLNDVTDWCVDSTGYAGATTTQYCDESTADCVFD